MEQTRTLYRQLGGIEPFRQIAAAFYARVETDDLLRPMYPEQLEPARERFALFLAQFFGGPSDYSALRGHPRLRMRHLPFRIGQAERDRWLALITAAVDEVGIAEPARSVMTGYFASASTFMINQPVDQAPVSVVPGTDLKLHLRSRRRASSANESASAAPLVETHSWPAAETAIVVCDMWDRHWCRGATARVEELAPRMNEVLALARERGVFIIHAPSDTLAFYADTPQRRLAQEAPSAQPPDGINTWNYLDPTRESPLPIDDSDGGCDDEPPCPTHYPWTRQHPAIEIAADDAISDRGDEVYNLLRQRGITRLIVMGVHLNMCVLGRPFSIRSLVKLGFQVALMRDMTDTMYNSRMSPHVDHFRGTDLMVEHVETYWCPTVTSADLTGQPEFRFRGASNGS